ncbi:Uncharacterised protein [Mycobacterium tuberculosis]|uniref:Uncharacterized protein n=1 Tax=Mycobacterium tuberculosis TaxID=1773 RepID=A0A655JAG2_MYCTX|nr:Uncharacterised protein [Mycobacterium tuberculosis]COW63201.1 Uncharacterised protein [Mycobacterium tuberculosis]COZ95424.1 Uncharacterised protein [Mycobacterium tuberculosis]
MTRKPTFSAYSCTVGMDGSQPPGKISARMNLVK